MGGARTGDLNIFGCLVLHRKDLTISERLIEVGQSYLRRAAVFLGRWRQGAGFVVGGRWFHIVVAEAAEKGA